MQQTGNESDSDYTVAVPYQLPEHWIRYQRSAIFNELVEAKATIKALKTTPYQKDWVDKLQELQLKMEAAGTSRIEGADFTERELEISLSSSEPADLTRSQRQVKAAANTYRWIADLPDDRPINGDLILEVHRRMVTGCDDDHCEPGKLRRRDDNVIFGIPPHRGCEGGAECERAFSQLAGATQGSYQQHDPLIQAMAVHYHFAAMYPFQDGNGRTARVLEALVLQRAGLRDTAFIAMSNYYYQEKPAYLQALSDVRAGRHDLTPFLQFALRGVAEQCGRLLSEIKLSVQKAVFRNTMYDLLGRLESPRKRVIAQRQLTILKILLEAGPLETSELMRLLADTDSYAGLKFKLRALTRDLWGLLQLRTIWSTQIGLEAHLWDIRLEWPTEINEDEFLMKYRKKPKAKTSFF